ncbi:hypothetical protein Goklo_025178 [Gossypium klotzschianum]|uniref:Uncharacterized protein n=1 Tax=Gossypium klotzschianum TaxID=34286 RepID=A0A7J8WEF3_9ROSI|nr:hypothetical protein [Gossypium klotzschianum]
MKSIQANNTFFLPRINGSNPRKPELLLPSYPYLVCFNAKVPVTKKLIASSSLCSQQFVPLLKHKRCVSVSKCWQGTTVCKFGGQDKPAGDNKWHYVCLGKTCQRNEQVALLLKVLKCDKSEIPSMYEFRNVYHFHAYLTLDEAENLSELEVEYIGLLSMTKVASKAKRTRSQTSNGLLKPKKQKTSMGSILSQWRQNKEKWRYNEGVLYVSLLMFWNPCKSSVISVCHDRKRGGWVSERYALTTRDEKKEMLSS